MSEPSPQLTAFPRDALIISAATTGSWPTKAQNPNVPTTPEEIARAAIDCGSAGAAIVHIHVRDDNEKVTCDPARYARVRELIEAAGSNVVINMSTGGGAGMTTDEERMAPVALAPEIASFDCGSLHFGDRVFVNSPQFLRELAKPLGVAARTMGGHARTGLEDNLYYRKGEPATSNAQLVARLARIAEELNRPL